MSKKNKKLKTELEGMHYSVLQDWVETGRKGNMPDEMVEYVQQLDLVRGLWYSCNTPYQIINKLQVHYPELDNLTATSRFQDACCYFFLDDKIKQDSWRNMIFEKHMQLYNAAVLSARSVDDYAKASGILERAYRAKRLHEKEEETIPEAAFTKPTKVYTLDTSDVGLPKANRNLLGEYIDQMLVTEEERLKIKQEASMEPKSIFDYDGESEEN